MTEVMQKAVKLLEALTEPHSGKDPYGDHGWRKCRRCLAQASLDGEGEQALLREVLALVRSAEGQP